MFWVVFLVVFACDLGVSSALGVFWGDLWCIVEDLGFPGLGGFGVL